MAGSFVVELIDSTANSSIELLDGLDGLVGEEMALEVAPGALDVIELRGVFKQPPDGQPGALVNLNVIGTLTVVSNVRPARIAGLNSQRRTAAMAASSSEGVPLVSSTLTSRHSPVDVTTRSSIVRPSRPARRADMSNGTGLPADGRRSGIGSIPLRPASLGSLNAAQGRLNTGR